ncbi:acyl-CoA synthetase (AMP-forming)/AMP-acid ligase II [Paenibacillus sacheonensis]|nr:acyl-CoA synthetase (AMP-forming)/AMP-acid ligase II [Paenibacillus sacheonensis]
MQRIMRIAHALRKSCPEQAKIAIRSGNRIEFAEVFLGAIYAGYVPVLLDPKWNPSETNDVIEQSRPSLMFCERGFDETTAEEQSRIQRLTFSDERPGSYDRWLASYEPETTEAFSERTHATLFIGFTSGTTGIPKGYMRSHDSWLRSFEATSAAFHLEQMEHVLAPGPFVHSLSLFALMQSLYGGATFHILQAFLPSEVVELCAMKRNMTLFVVPTMIDSLLELSDPARASIHALISSGGTWSPSSKQRCRQAFAGAKLYEYYGSSEASYISYMDANP